ncbi:hypothetical protein MRS44_013291 [Fusarium solani]|uniref:uncharacterized protein n=1 Tax=Fusarium solani TaxID=169388 RepID=UPI0032C4133F|nr:hypothetical protein MRS44_013291 [Fusarium solani]
MVRLSPIVLALAANRAFAALAPAPDSELVLTLIPRDNTTETSLKAVGNTWMLSPTRCAEDTSTTDSVQAIMDDVNPPARFDIMLTTFPNGESDWLNKLWTTVFPNQGFPPHTVGN